MAQMTPARVADRYGKKRNRRIDVWVGGSAAAILVLGGVAFLWFGGMPTAESAIEFRDIAHRIDDAESRASLTFQVTAPATSDVICEVEALNTSYAVAGSKLVEVPSNGERTRTVTEELRTHNPATTVTVKNCWVQSGHEDSLD